jgi:hypothetical protein
LLGLQQVLKMLALHCHSSFGATMQGMMNALKKKQSVLQTEVQPL